MDLRPCIVECILRVSNTSRIGRCRLDPVGDRPRDLFLQKADRFNAAFTGYEESDVNEGCDRLTVQGRGALSRPSLGLAPIDDNARQTASVWRYG
jgi:hypothetical protein